ncbi:MAG: 30S ribosome-binding factor RbfA [Ignavibacteria bacterium]|nr:30S ribosome-binding factor RbfA [Ignavibacteria bacterium]
MAFRTEKVASEIQKVISQPISEFARRYNAGLATVTAVRMSPDLQIAKIYISIYGGKVSPQTFINLLDEEVSQFRQILATKVRLRFVPEIRFYHDDSFDKIENIEKLLSQDKERFGTKK